MARIFDEHELLNALGAPPTGDGSFEFRGLTVRITSDGPNWVASVDGFDGDLPFPATLSGRIRVARDLLWLASLPRTMSDAVR